MSPRVWHMRDPNKPADAIYVGRGSQWGNPYKINYDGNRRVCIMLFENNTLPELDLAPLRGKDLVCHCAPKECHADVLLREANR